MHYFCYLCKQKIYFVIIARHENITQGRSGDAGLVYG